ncbi:MAG: hypothetical protein AAF944_28715 [Bacteroidota bacterium]
MNRTLIFNRNFPAFGIPLSLFGALIFLIKSPLLGESNSLALAITIDLLLTIPLVYLFLIRQTDIPKTTAVPVMVAGLLIGSYFLPQDSQIYLNLFKTWALPAIEISVLTFTVLKVRSAISKYKHLKGVNPDFFSTLKSTCYEILPTLAVMPVVTEVSVIYYGFLSWKTRALQKNEFTYHKESGTLALLGALIFMIIIETLVFHLLLVKWNIIIAWILSGLSIYTALQVFGFARSLSKRPISIGEDHLGLRYGISNEADIPLVDIEKVELTSQSVEGADFVKLSPLGELESHNVVIWLKEESIMTGLYGTKKKFRIIGLHVDDPARLKASLDSII